MSSFILNAPLFCIVASLLSAVTCSVLISHRAEKLCWGLLAAVLAGNLSLLVYQISTGEAVSYMMGHYPAPWGNELRFGILEPLVASILGFVLLLTAIGGRMHYFSQAQTGHRSVYFTMICLLQAAMMALLYTNDIFTGYVFIEIATLATCAVLVSRNTPGAIAAGVRYMIFSLIGSGLFLLGTILLYDITGHLLFPNIRETVGVIWQSGNYRLPLTVSISLITVGLGIKSGLFPFHFWMADTYGSASPGAAGTMSGVVSKLYIFFLIKIIHCGFGSEVYYASGAQNVLFVFGICGALVGSISAIHQHDINRMTAFSSAAQIGYIYMALGISGKAGVVAALFQLITHAITKPPLFLSLARLRDVSDNSPYFSDLQGSAHRDRLAGICFTVGAMSMVGMPTLAGFVVKLSIAGAAVSTAAGYKAIPVLVTLALSTVLNTVYFLRTVLRIYTPSQTHPADPSAPWWTPKNGRISATISYVTFIALNFGFGLCSQPILMLLERGVALLG